MKKSFFSLSLVALLFLGIALATPAPLPLYNIIPVTVNCYLNNTPTQAQVGYTQMNIDPDYYYFSPNKSTKTIVWTDSSGKLTIKMTKYKNYFIRAELHAMVNSVPTSYYSWPVNIYNLSASQTIRLDLK